MRRALLILPLAALALLAWVVASGADARAAQWAAGWQREFQNALAGTLRALRNGEPGALALTTGLCFAYGVVHAVGPGHGKVLIGGYGVGRRVPVLRLSAIAMAAALGQAVTAIAVVGVGILALGWTRTRATGVVEGIMAPASAAAIGLIGLWLALRGARRLWRGAHGDPPAAARAFADGDGAHGHAQALGDAHRHGHDHGYGYDHDHDHDHDHDAERHHHRHGPDGTCGCGHRHAPTIDEVRAATGPRDVAALVAGIAIRPCSGALLLLVLTWHMGILAAGIAGTLAMSMGTGAVTVGVAVAAVTARESALLSLGESVRAPRLLPLVELAAGATIALVAVRMLFLS